MSAEAKVNLAFDQIINGYPFDGTKAEVESFFEKMSGFDRYVFEQFPRFKGQLAFTGSSGFNVPSGSYIVVKDYAGALYPELSKNKTGQSILNPTNGVSLSIETLLYIESGYAPIGSQILCQKLNGPNQGLTLWLQEGDVEDANIFFTVTSGSNSLFVNANFQLSQWNHICATLNKDQTPHCLELYLNGELVSRSTPSISIGDLDIDSSDFTIASGSAFYVKDDNISVDPPFTFIEPAQTFSGSLDEFRVWHSVRSVEQQKLYMRKAIYAQPDLKLYYRFNEPPPPLSTTSNQVNAIVLDSSGNSLHSTITNFELYAGVDVNGIVMSSLLRQDTTADPKSIMIYERNDSVPVLFPAHEELVDLNVDLLNSASDYDQANPNLITRLIPRHYLLEGAQFDGFNEPESLGGDPYGGNGIPGEGERGDVQLMLSMLYVFARFFDEMKLYVDAFSSLRTVDYDENKSTPNNFLRDIIKQYGFHLPTMFNDSTIEQHVYAENVDQEISTSATPLKHVQNELLRRILFNLPEIIRSKGTQHSIKSFLRAVGIDPENSVRVREFGGPTSRQLTFARENKRSVDVMVNFATSSLAISNLLTASRLEIGYPNPNGTFTQKNSFPPHGLSNSRNDGLFTSGSWTVETTVKYGPENIASMTSATQSIVRLHTTASVHTFSPLDSYVIANLIAISSSEDPRIILYFRPGTSSTNSPLLMLSASFDDNNIFNGERWSVSFGCERNDSINSRVSSSYFLRVGSQNNGNIDNVFITSSFFSELTPGGGQNILRMFSLFNTGTYLAVGNQDIVSGAAANSYVFLNTRDSDSGIPAEARASSFTGMQSGLRFWSKALSINEWLEHVMNPRSVGVSNPMLNYNYVHASTGAFERLRLDTFRRQENVRANATASLGTLGTITFLDFSENGMHMTGSGFPIEEDCVRTETVDYSHLSPYFDEAATNEKVRIRSYQNQMLVNDTPWAERSPVYELVKSEQPTDDVRFAIDFSLVDALNRDIMTIFSSLEFFDNALGNPELLYSPDYPTFEKMRDVYFNRIKEKLNFKSFFEFFRWFDMSIGTFIEQLIPRKTNFRGMNFTVESHVLERHKLEYVPSEMYLLPRDRARIKDSLFVQQIVGSVNKH